MSEALAAADPRTGRGGYIERAEPVIFIGDGGAGKTHLLTGWRWQPAGRNAECDSPRPQH